MTTVVISQPMYFPWVGFIGQMALADVYVWLDDAQFSKGGFTNRVQVKAKSGPVWMTIPLAGGGTYQEIRQLTPAASDWQRRHRELLRQQLRVAPHLSDALAIYDECVAKEPMVEVLIASAERSADYLGVRPQELLRSSEMAIGGSASERVVGLVKAVHGTRYVTGHGAANYLNHGLFEEAGIEVEYMDYDVSPWHQSHGAFTPYVTVLDAIAWLGAKAAEYLPTRTIDWRMFLAERKS